KFYIYISAEDITPYSDYQFADEGESVTLFCSYTGSVQGLHWYRQYAGSPPKFLILDYCARSKSSEEDIPDGFQSTTSQSSTELTILKAALSDSALYYCALEVAQCYKIPEKLYKNLHEINALKSL
uniref:Ig-like domain-containing protein n=1 Tax=Cyprinus carpio carpio TaxID=630221 RepID=A0A8C1EV06_CYPCA